MRREIVALVGVLAMPIGVAAQAPAPAAGPGPSFMIFRYASVSSLAMYSGYHAGTYLIVAGLLHNPRSSYEEAMGGVGRPFTLPGGSLTIASAVAYTNTSWYQQLYLIPSLKAGPLRLDVTAEYAQPWTARGTRGFFVSPGTALVDLSPRLRIGAAYYDDIEAGSPAAHTAGPALQLMVPNGSITVDYVKNLTNAKDEMHVFLRSSL